MEKMLLNKKEVAKILDISTSTLDRRVREGLIPTVKGHKTPKFNLYEVMKVAGTEVDRLSHFERRRLDREKAELEQRIIELEEENRIIKSKITNSVADLSQILREV